jgi:hypothetical protein
MATESAEEHGKNIFPFFGNSKQIVTPAKAGVQLVDFPG